MKKSLVAAAVAVACMGTAHATNWFQLQGTEPNGTAPLYKVFGFIQPTYFSTGGSTVSGLVGPGAAFNGTAPNFNLVAPQHTSSSSFEIMRARIAVRGTVLPISNKIDYFIMAEFGNNGATQVPGGSVVRLTDASVTFNQIPGARVRVGLFKAPGAEEMMMGIPAMDYVNFTTVTQQLLFNEFTNGNVYTNAAAKLTGGAGGYEANVAENDVERDIGVQVFDWFNNGPWQFTYAGMVGNGAPINGTQTASQPSYYARVQESYIFHHSKGPHQAGVTAWLWGHVGHGQLNVGSATSAYTTQNYTYERFGGGAQFRSSFMTPGAMSATGEWMRGNGWILVPAAFGLPPGGAVCGAGTTGNPLCTGSIYPGHNNQADGWYLQGGVFATRNVQLEVRYDQYNRLINSAANERIFKTWTFGAQYWFSPMARVTLNYAVNRLVVPFPKAAGPNANPVANSMDNVISLQTTLMF